MCHHECPEKRLHVRKSRAEKRVTIPSRKKAAGQPMDIFHFVRVEQKILSIFHTKNPNRNMPNPMLKKLAIEALVLAGTAMAMSDH
jgi:hypothetical protein